MGEEDMNSPMGKNLVGVVLAGGASRRFGSEKALLRRGGRTFLEIAVERLRPLCREVVLSVDQEGRFGPSYSIPEVTDVQPGGGAAVGIMSVLRRYPGASALVTPVDMPLMPAGLLRRLLDSRGDAIAAALKVKGRWQPLVGVYGPEAAAIIEECIEAGERKIVLILARMSVSVVRPSEQEKALLVNINTPQDLARVENSERKAEGKKGKCGL